MMCSVVKDPIMSIDPMLHQKESQEQINNKYYINNKYTTQKASSPLSKRKEKQKLKLLYAQSNKLLYWTEYF